MYPFETLTFDSSRRSYSRTDLARVKSIINNIAETYQKKVSPNSKKHIEISNINWRISKSEDLYQLHQTLQDFLTTEYSKLFSNSFASDLLRGLRQENIITTPPSDIKKQLKGQRFGFMKHQASQIDLFDIEDRYTIKGSDFSVKRHKARENRKQLAEHRDYWKMDEDSRQPMSKQNTDANDIEQAVTSPHAPFAMAQEKKLFTPLWWRHAARACPQAAELKTIIEQWIKIEEKPPNQRTLPSQDLGRLRLYYGFHGEFPEEMIPEKHRETLMERIKSEVDENPRSDGQSNEYMPVYEAGAGVRSPPLAELEVDDPHFVESKLYLKLDKLSAHGTKKSGLTAFVNIMLEGRLRQSARDAHLSGELDRHITATPHGPPFVIIDDSTEERKNVAYIVAGPVQKDWVSNILDKAEEKGMLSNSERLDYMTRLFTLEEFCYDLNDACYQSSAALDGYLKETILKSEAVLDEKIRSDPNNNDSEMPDPEAHEPKSFG